MIHPGFPVHALAGQPGRCQNRLNVLSLSVCSVQDGKICKASVGCITAGIDVSKIKTVKTGSAHQPFDRLANGNRLGCFRSGLNDGQGFVALYFRIEALFVSAGPV